VPASWRLTTPISCPSGTTDSAVVSHVERNEKGTIVTKFELHCIDADEGATTAMGFAVFGGMFLYGAAFALVFALAQLARSRANVAVVTLSALLLTGCEFGTLTRDEFAARYPYGEGRMFSRGRAESAARALETQLGGPQRVTNVSVSPESVMFQVVGHGTDVDMFTYRDPAGLDAPTPLRSSEEDTTATDAFDLHPADLASIYAIVREAPRRIGLEGSHVTSVSFFKNGGIPELRVDVVSRRHSGSARYDVHGTLIEVRVD
jgi:hypothetical protein